MFLTGLRITRRKGWPALFCANPMCREALTPTSGWVRASRWELCPSCRVSFGRGALVAGVLGLVYHLVTR